jgi:hypothetical protein
MKDIINKLADLNRIDPSWEYSVEIKSTGAFILHGLSADSIFNKILGLPEKKRRIVCKDDQDLRTEMYRIILNLRK